MSETKPTPASGLITVALAIFAAPLAGMTGAAEASPRSEVEPGASIVVAQPSPERPMLTARVSRWQGDPVETRKAPEGFDLEFRLVGVRFDGTFKVEGLPHSVPEAEAFDVQLKLTNVGPKKDIRVSSVSVMGDGMILNTTLVDDKVDPKSVSTVARFRVPPQSAVGSSFQITVVLSNGDKHMATLSFTPAS